MLDTTATNVTYRGCYYVLGLVVPVCSIEKISAFEDAINEQQAIHCVAAMDRIQKSRERTDELVKKLNAEEASGFEKTILTVIKRELITRECKSFT